MEEIDTECAPDGTITKVRHGIERIPDIMLLKEMLAYRDGLNVDRLVAFCSLVAFAKVQESNRGYTKRVEREESNNLQKPNKNANLFMNPFRHIGTTNGNSKLGSGQQRNRSAFKNMR